MGEPPWLYLNQRGRRVQLFYTKRSSMTYSFKQFAQNLLSCLPQRRMLMNRLKLVIFFPIR